MWHRSSLARRGAALGSIAALLCCSGGTAKAEETRAGSIRWDLVVGGSAFFVGSYGAAELRGGLAKECSGPNIGGHFATEEVCRRAIYPRLLIPLAGPFTYLGQVESRPLGLLLVADGTLQVAGVAVAIAGLVWRKPPSTEALRWTPFVGHRTVGLAGTF